MDSAVQQCVTRELGAINNKRRAETLGQQLRIVQDSEVLAEQKKTGRSQSIPSRKTVVEGASDMDHIFVGKGESHTGSMEHSFPTPLDGASKCVTKIYYCIYRPRVHMLAPIRLYLKDIFHHCPSMDNLAMLPFPSHNCSKPLALRV